MRAPSVFALADDLSGAAETAAVLMSSGRPARIALSGPPYASSAPVMVADLDCRYRAGAGEVVREALRHAGERRVFVKVDSLLRGDVGATAAATLDAAILEAAFSRAAAPALVVLAPALPSAGRVTVGGVPRIGGLSLRETRAWQVERRPAPASIADALGGVPVALVPLATVRADRADRADRATLVRALSRTAGRVAVCDAETDADLDAIVAATLTADPRAHLIGAGGLASALGRTLAFSGDRTGATAPGRTLAFGGDRTRATAPGRISDGHPPIAPRPSTQDRPLLIVVGTAEPGAADQARRLLPYGAHPLTLDATTDLAPAHRAHIAHRLRTALRPSTALVVLTLTGQGPPDAATALAEIVATALTGDHTPDLVLTGGETARRVLDALKVHELTPVGQIHHGAVHCHTPEGRSVVTRPGSFGDRDSLLNIAAHLAPERLT
ncbi:hypothetical protein FXF51_55405 [Nonomuraea sp. PA05]|uniref:four-carbon acid sugar kinase family protein n=1 Tax=Nonomuraea sp. PA05 TaxID=2604466 RepID=UPI0011D47CD6|nr:four-carbon acid sugar kinase family protein [Nonomuraea sp. PA05]TYB50699.1 hypothetical protein FXF51_55405 [Nonomuraea sp. PA05]